MNLSSLSGALTNTSDSFAGNAQLGSAAARVYSRLRNRIIMLELLPDTVLSRAEIAKDNGVSQSPVREAIQKLEQDGLVVSYPQSKTLVTRIDISHARETQFLRLGVELEVTRALAKKRDTDLLQPSSRILRMQTITGEDGDFAEFTALDRLFHRSLFQAAGVPSLWDLISGRSGHIDRLRQLNLPDPGKMAAVLNAHEKILAAISAGDLAAVEESVRRHLSGTLASIPTIQKAHPAYFEDMEPESSS